MKPEAQRIAIAEACGWRHEKTPDYDAFYGPASGYRGGATHNIAVAMENAGVPDYLSDLNAMHEAEKTLDAMDPIKRHEFCHELKRVCDTTQVPYILSATAAQRAEAFLRTLNLWTE